MISANAITAKPLLVSLVNGLSGGVKIRGKVTPCLSSSMAPKTVRFSATIGHRLLAETLHEIRHLHNLVALRRLLLRLGLRLRRPTNLSRNIHRQTKRLAVFQKRRNRHIVQFPVLVNETRLADRINPSGKDTRSGHDSRILGTQRLRITQRPLQCVHHGLMRETMLGNTLLDCHRASFARDPSTKNIIGERKSNHAGSGSVRGGFQDFTAPTLLGLVSNAVLNALTAFVNRVMSSSVLGGLGVMSVVYAPPTLKVLTSLWVTLIGMLTVNEPMGNVLSLIVAVSSSVAGCCSIIASLLMLLLSIVCLVFRLGLVGLGCF
nr:MAG TPA: hypothetical protein [Caudoviricetes sp.]